MISRLKISEVVAIKVSVEVWEEAAVDLCVNLVASVVVLAPTTQVNIFYLFSCLLKWDNIFVFIKNQRANNRDLYFQLVDLEEVVLWEAVAAVEWAVDEVVVLLAEETHFNVHQLFER